MLELIGTKHIKKGIIVSKKIPDHAKCVHQGPVFKVYQWEENLPNGEKRIFEIAERKSGALIIPLDEKGNVYYGEQQQQGFGNKPFVGLLGGEIEEGETSLETAKRELLEEGGLISNEWELFWKWDYFGRLEGFVDVFVARNCKKTERPELNDGEKIVVKKCSLERYFREILSAPNCRDKAFKAQFYNRLNEKTMKTKIQEILGKG
ncbi:MAG: NUDIX hydrolase [Alphaproteobacteria bacterium]|nr:MAG: hypothetical protein B6I23_01510 [Rickettsiaceae bacterium 4572_127]